MCLLFYPLRASHVWEGAERRSLNKSRTLPNLGHTPVLSLLVPGGGAGGPAACSVWAGALAPWLSETESGSLLPVFPHGSALLSTSFTPPPPSSSHTSSAPDNTSASAIVAAIPADGDFLWSGPPIG